VSTLSIFSLNIDAHPLDREKRVQDVSDIIKNLDPDIVLLQETTPKQEGFDASNVIADQTGLNLSISNPLGTAILSKFSAIQSFPLELTGSISRPSASFAMFQTPSHPLLVCSAHLSWGSAMEVERLEQAQLIDKVFNSYGAVEPFREGGNGILSFLGGDLNAVPDSSTIKWLKGLTVENSQSTHWTDSWIRGDSEGFTSDNKNPLLTRTAEGAGIGNWIEAPLPSRRIDYIFSRGFAFGRAGAPLESRLINSFDLDPFPSDHYGILADFSL
jgi:endonuclease/exonuclease/phosphatase family metal-dependent hydrolase